MKPILPILSRIESDSDTHAWRFVIAITVTLATVLELIDTSIVNVAIPHMMGSLGATLDEIAWVSTGYVVANVIVLSISGWLSEYFGRRNYFALSIILFTLSSIMCGNATTLGGLVFWRIVQGLGGGGLISTAQATIYEIFPAREAATAMAIFGMGIMSGPMLGPTLGGWITDTWSWPWIFYINIPLGIFALLLTLMFVPDSKFGTRASNVDGFGFLLLAVGIGCLQTMLERGERLNWFESREILAYAFFSITALLLFVRQELRHPHPIVQLRILRDRQFAACMIFGFLLGTALYGTVFILPVYMQTLLGFTAWDSGMVVMPGAVASAVGMVVAGQLMDKTRLDLRIYPVFGALIFGYSMWRHSLFTTGTGWDDFLWPMLLRGFGLSMIFLPINNLSLGNLPQHYVAGGSGLFNLMRQLGGSVGIAVTATLFAQFQEQNRGELLRHVTPYAMATQERLAHLKTLMMAHGVSENLAQTKALLLMNAQVGRQAAMLSYDRLFLLYGITLFCALPLLFLMQKSDLHRGGEVMH